mmetsp:Transcript_37474/g.98293  ORF Transcript_37474/g.98293 Transcript_37474/m.98293 type:complete len:211 (-) Transcript_37474:2455-3087(-)
MVMPGRIRASAGSNTRCVSGRPRDERGLLKGDPADGGRLAAAFFASHVPRKSSLSGFRGEVEKAGSGDVGGDGEAGPGSEGDAATGDDLSAPPGGDDAPAAGDVRSRRAADDRRVPGMSASLRDTTLGTRDDRRRSLCMLDGSLATGLRVTCTLTPLNDVKSPSAIVDTDFADPGRDMRAEVGRDRPATKESSRCVGDVDSTLGLTGLPS